MRKLLKEWNRLAFSNGTRLINESESGHPALAPLVQMGFYHAGTDEVVIGDLEDFSSKEYSREYPADDPMEQGPFHVQVVAEANGTVRIAEYCPYEMEEVCRDWPAKNELVVGSGEEAVAMIQRMAQCYEKFMDVYEIALEIGAVVDAYYPALDTKHPEIQQYLGT
jgi:hypothetical protein